MSNVWLAHLWSANRALANGYTRAASTEQRRVCTTLATCAFDIQIMTRAQMRSTPEGLFEVDAEPMPHLQFPALVRNP